MELPEIGPVALKDLGNPANLYSEDFQQICCKSTEIDSPACTAGVIAILLPLFTRPYHPYHSYHPYRRYRYRSAACSLPFPSLPLLLPSLPPCLALPLSLSSLLSPYLPTYISLSLSLPTYLSLSPYLPSSLLPPYLSLSPSLSLLPYLPTCLTLSLPPS